MPSREDWEDLFARAEAAATRASEAARWRPTLPQRPPRHTERLTEQRKAYIKLREEIEALGGPGLGDIDTPHDEVA